MALASGVWGRGLVISTRCSRSAAGSIASLCPYGRASVDFADRCTPAWWQWLRSGALVASRYRANLRPASPWRTASCMHSAAMADKKALQASARRAWVDEPLSVRGPPCCDRPAGRNSSCLLNPDVQVLQRPAFQFLGDLFARNGFEIRYNVPQGRHSLALLAINSLLPHTSPLLTPGAPTRLRLVGGAVRDLIIGREPKDYDFCTPSRPDNSLRILKEAGVHVIETGALKNRLSQQPFDCVTLR